MIAKLRGLVDALGEDSCIIDVNGVGYLVFASAKTLSKLVVGAEASLLIETVVREDSISLFGFYDAWEKEWFNTLTKVQGVGAKVCLAILSVLSPLQLAQAVSAQDKNSFTRASGVGPKLAARIVTELKDKIVTIPTSEMAKDLDMNMTPQEDANSVADILAAQQGDPDKIEDKGANGQRRGCLGCTPPELCVHPGPEYGQREGLGDIVVRPGLQTGHLIQLQIIGGEQDHRHGIALRPHLAQKVQPAAVGKIDVQDQ